MSTLQTVHLLVRTALIAHSTNLSALQAVFLMGLLTMRRYRQYVKVGKF
jgi:hypothetical protein